MNPKESIPDTTPIITDEDYEFTFEPPIEEAETNVVYPGKPVSRVAFTLPQRGYDIIKDLPHHTTNITFGQLMTDKVYRQRTQRWLADLDKKDHQKPLTPAVVNNILTPPRNQTPPATLPVPFVKNATACGYGKIGQQSV